jgi:membrane-associated phospholipid phosphatase
MIGSKALHVLIVAGGILGTVGAAAAQETTVASGSPTATADSQESQAKPAPPNPEPEHTGLAAIVYKTGADFNAFPRRKSTWVILGIGGAAAALAHPADNSVNRRMVGSNAAGKFFAPGKYIGSAYVQVGTAVGLYTIGRYVLPEAKDGKRTNKVSHLGFDLLRAAIVSQALTQGLKYSVRRERPNGKANSFPSGHASATFAAAAVLERHLGYRGAWPTIAIASYVAASRLHDNVHYLSDVVFGAALGTASGWTVVGRHGRSDYTFIPVPIRGGAMIALVKNSDHGGLSSAAPASQRK